MPALREKQQVVLAILTAALEGIKPGLKTADRYRRVTEVEPGTPERRRVMNEDGAGTDTHATYYLEVLAIRGGAPTSSTGIDDRGEAGTPYEVAHTLTVTLWLAYADADTYAASSQATWDTLTEGSAGLLPTLRQAGYADADVGGTCIPVYVQQPQIEGQGIMGADSTDRHAEHFLTLTVGVVGPDAGHPES